MDKEVKNLNLNLSSKQSFSIDGDPNKIVEIDTHDLGVLTRLKNAIKALDDIQERWHKVTSTEQSPEDMTIDDVVEFSDSFDAVELDMRNLVDGIFDSEGMCDTILGKASIFSPVNGMFKYEQIITTFCGLYETDIKKEAEKINLRTVDSRVAKYTHK